MLVLFYPQVIRKHIAGLLTLIDDKNRSELEAVIVQVKQELRSLFVTSGEQIKELGNAIKKVVKKEESICEEIKIALKEEIAEGLISTRTIELHCPPEWKRKTKPKQRENEKISFSKGTEKPQQQQIAATQEGISVIINKTSSNTSTSSDNINQFHDQSEQNGISDDGNKAQTTIDKKVSYNESSTIQDFPSSGPSYKQTGRECPNCLELQDKVIQLSEAFQHISIPTADQIPPSEFEFTIPKENYDMVKEAMNKSNSAIFVKCDERKKFVRAVPDG